MATVLVRFTVRNYLEWKATFLGRRVLRAELGSRGGRLFRDADRPEDVVLVLEWSDLDSARAYCKSDDLRKALEGAGVQDMEVRFLDEVDNPSF